MRVGLVEIFYYLLLFVSIKIESKTVRIREEVLELWEC